MTNEIYEEMLNDMDIDKSARGESLSTTQFVELSNKIAKFLDKE